MTNPATFLGVVPIKTQVLSWLRRLHLVHGIPTSHALQRTLRTWQCRQARVFLKGRLSRPSSLPGLSRVKGIKLEYCRQRADGVQGLVNGGNDRIKALLGRVISSDIQGKFNKYHIKLMITIGFSSQAGRKCEFEPSSVPTLFPAELGQLRLTPHASYWPSADLRNTLAHTSSWLTS